MQITHYVKQFVVIYSQAICAATLLGTDKVILLQILDKTAKHVGTFDF